MAAKLFSVIVWLGVATTSVLAQQSSPTILCEGVEKNSFVPDPEDCSKFFQCNGNTHVHGTCPNGMYYHSIDVCSFDASECQTSATILSTTTEHPVLTSATSSTASPALTTPIVENSTDPVEFCLTADPYRPHFIKSPTLCSEYYICVDHKPILRKCAQGTYWNQEHLYCDDPKNVPCEHDQLPDPEEFCRQSETTEVTFTASPTDCGDYYVCIQQKPFLMHCAPGSYWHSEAELCDDPKIAKCKIFNRPPPNFDELCMKSNSTFLSHPTYCDLFIFCRNGKAFTQRCPFLTDWDPSAERCALRGSIKCTKQRRH